ncbi:837_t:CDS:2 [Ambispora gerdemannii]|uniref:ATP-dependent (S)-NAD(P)H-hydrate dehydratase n=1 Tax=Ambispora gerdemannii TaxID=144530 RepID=A0A9N8ZB68_9GLOM|nr:837_t:CDS:2 [Ambispora gerdemannii]
MTSKNLNALLIKVKQLIPPLSADFHKGQAGRICVIGGSEEYTGAPYFSSMAALRIANLMVYPYMRTSEKNYSQTPQQITTKVAELFPRMHVIVVGPGLSRDKLMQECARGIITKAKEKDLAIVLDADALFLVQNHPDVVKNYKKAVLTPNVNEFKRLCEALNVGFDESQKGGTAQRLSQALGGVTIVQKGKVDVISNEEQTLCCDIPGGLKRCGGQGDILSGVIATFLAWGKAYQAGLWEHDQSITASEIPLLASFAGCKIVRECSRVAFEKFGRATQTSDILKELGSVFQKDFER